MSEIQKKIENEIQSLISSIISSTKNKKEIVNSFFKRPSWLNIFKKSNANVIEIIDKQLNDVIIDTIEKTQKGFETVNNKIDKYDINPKIRKEILAEKIRHKHFSDRIWDSNQNFRKEVENILKNNLDEKVRIEIFKKMMNNNEYNINPGRGVYKDPVKNIMRVINQESKRVEERSKTKMYNQNKRIIAKGIKVSESYNIENDNVVVCSSLQGIYPKDYEWSGWHIGCKCQTYPIYADENMKSKDIEYVKDKPDSYSNFVEENKDKWKNWKNPPIFIQ